MKRFLLSGGICSLLAMAAMPHPAIAAPGGLSAVPAQIEAAQPSAILQTEYYYDRYHHRHWRRPPPPPRRYYHRPPPPPFRR